jgi:hypothetical protein
MVRLFLTLVSRQALSDGGVALSMFHDADDDCLRIFEYVRQNTEPRFQSFEMLPSPGYFAKDVFRELRRMTGLRRFPGAASLRFKRNGGKHAATCEAFSETDFRIYFTADRPPIRLKHTKW